MRIKKFICLFLVCMFCFAASVCVLAQEQNEQVSDIELLNMLGVFTGYEDGNLHPDWSITRMEFAAIIIRALGYDNGIGQMQTGFSDVPFDLWGSGYVKMAYDLGIVSGYGDSTFRPDNKITESESIKMIVAALGYSYWAERNGGYPNGYISIGSRLDILERAVDSSKEATRGYVAAILVNALETRIVHPEEENIAEYDDNLLLRLGISVRKGTISAVYGASVSGDTELKKDEVIISGEIFKTNLIVSRDFIGSNVKIYVKDYGRDEELIVGIVGDKGDDSLTVYAEDILDSTTLSEFVYYNEDRKTRKESLEDNIKISYNGMVIDNSADYTATRLKPESGYVRLMDTDKNGRYDTAVVKDYKTFVVRGVSDRVISDEYGGKIDIDEETIISVTKDGQLLSLGDIMANDVISAAVSLDGSVVEIIICRDSIEGVVEAFEDDEDERYYTLDDGKEYRLTPAYIDAINRGYSSAEKIELGNSMTFYLNSFGEIAMGVLSAETEKEIYYGYVVDMAKNHSIAKENILSFKILGEENRYLYLDTIDASTITFGRMDGSTYKETKENSDYIYNAMLYNGKIEKQLVKYELKDGSIKAMHLRDNNTFSENFSRDVPRQSLNVRYHTIDSKYYWDDDTVCFYIPQNGLNIAALSSGPCVDYFSGEDSLVMELWDIEEDGRINAIYCSDTSTGRILASGSIYYLDYVNSPVMYVTKVSNIVSDDGTDYKVVEGWQDKKLVRTLLSDTLSQNSSDIRPGVVIQYTTNEQQKMFAETVEDDVTMVVYSVLFDLNNYYSEEFMSYDYTGSQLEGARIQFGYSNVSRLDYPFIRFAKDDCVFEAHSGTTVYIYSQGSKQIRKGSIGDLTEHIKVFMRARYGNLREVVVIED